MKTYKWDDGFEVVADIFFGKVEGYKNLGYTNGMSSEENKALWNRIGKSKCYSLKRGNCDAFYICPDLKITFSIDSSD